MIKRIALTENSEPVEPYANHLASLGQDAMVAPTIAAEKREIAPSTKLQFSRWAKNCAIGLYIMSVIWGVLQILFPEHVGLYLISALCFALLATFWARFDSKARGIFFLPILQMLYFLLWPLGATVYLIYRSGWRGLLTAGLHGIGIILLMTVTFNVTLFCLHFAGLLDARYYPT